VGAEPLVVVGGGWADFAEACHGAIFPQNQLVRKSSSRSLRPLCRLPARRPFTSLRYNLARKLTVDALAEQTTRSKVFLQIRVCGDGKVSSSLTNFEVEFADPV
jgi:hypothetical protein